MSEGRGTSVDKRRKLFHYADVYRMERVDRHAFAEVLLRRDVNSWKDLTDEQVDRLLDAFEGHMLLAQHLADAVSPAAKPG